MKKPTNNQQYIKLKDFVGKFPYLVRALPNFNNGTIERQTWDSIAQVLNSCGNSEHVKSGSEWKKVWQDEKHWLLEDEQAWFKTKVREYVKTIKRIPRDQCVPKSANAIVDSSSGLSNNNKKDVTLPNLASTKQARREFCFKMKKFILKPRTPTATTSTDIQAPQRQINIANSTNPCQQLRKRQINNVEHEVKVLRKHLKRMKKIIDGQTEAAKANAEATKALATAARASADAAKAQADAAKTQADAAKAQADAAMAQADAAKCQADAAKSQADAVKELLYQLK